MPDIRKLVGSKIRDYRKAKGLSQDQLGELCGFHFSYIGGVERGERNISLENIAKIAEALDVEPRMFFEFDGTFLSPLPEEKDTEIQELISLLKSKDVRHIQMIKNIYIEIISTFSQKN